MSLRDLHDAWWSTRRTVQLLFIVVAGFIGVGLVWPDFVPLLPRPDGLSADMVEADQAYCQDPRTNPSRIAGGLPGFLVLDNVWYRDRQFYAMSEHRRPWPDSHELASGNWIGMKVMSFTELNEPDILGAMCMRGTTLFLNDGGPGRPNYFWGFYWFVAEAILGSIAALSSAEPVTDRMPERLIVPWEPNFQESTGANEQIVHRVFKESLTVDDWRVLADSDPKPWLMFPRVVIVDRDAAHEFNPIANSWNKMALPAFSLPRSTSFFEPFRLQYFASLSLSAPLRPTPGLGIRPVPHVLFIEHPASSRRYRLGEYEGLVGLLRRLEEEGKATVSMPEWETLDLKHKTMETGRADVMLGTHDESLAWAMWMPRGGAVIELLPAGAFTLDYAAVAEAVSHSYTAVWEDRIYDQSEWADNAGEMHGGLLDKDRHVPIDVDFLDGLLRQTIDDMTPGTTD